MPITVRPCEECGDPFEAKTRRAKFCGAKCRVRANRRPSKTGAAKAAGKVAGGGIVTVLPAAAGPGDQSPPGPTYDTLAETLRRDLEEQHALQTISGMAALRVAQQIDRGGDSGSAVATLTKELTRLVDAAKAEAAASNRNPDGADVLRSQVTAKLQLVAQ